MRIITLSLFAVLLSACNSVEVQQKTNAVTSPISSFEQDTAESWITLAQATKDEATAAEHYLNAAEILFNEDKGKDALDILLNHVIHFKTLTAFKGLLLTAKINNQQNKPLTTLSYLSKAKRLPMANHPNYSNDISLLRSETLEKLESWPAAVKERVKLSLSLPLDELENNQNQLWSNIQNLTNSEVNYLQNGNDSILNGWLHISSILRKSTLTTSEQILEFNQWQQTNLLHPASSLPPKDFLLLSSIHELAPKKISLLLPLTGKLRKASRAVLDGFLYAYYSQSSPRPELNLIDTNTIESMQDALNQVQISNPDIIIGPLQKSHVAKLSNLELTIPTISLNRLDFQNTQPNLFHFSLSSADEIIELVRYAQNEGAQRGAVISTQDTWALRQSDEFRSIARNKGVELLAQLDYENTPKSRQNTIKELLLVNESQKRKKWLESTLSEEITSVERSRQDLDYVFFAGRFDDAKQIRPLLDFYFASDIPLLSTSTINNKQLNEITKQEDIERIIFSEIPSITKKDKTNTPHKEVDSNFIKRLKSLGQDAYLIANRFPIFQEITNAKISGDTGILSLNNNQVFNKRSELVTYRQGRLTNATETSENELTTP
ncbi:penicillin-binding protein activator [Marinomonas sp. 2405UD68-3]|uniref:penicillin-binding protein activator n=1 Tax=Marinomonas sp. 2405UD68-3 TaxID=3391835 RepID=UPI0039C94568